MIMYKEDIISRLGRLHSHTPIFTTLCPIKAVCLRLAEMQGIFKTKPGDAGRLGRSCIWSPHFTHVLEFAGHMLYMYCAQYSRLMLTFAVGRFAGRPCLLGRCDVGCQPPR